MRPGRPTARHRACQLQIGLGLAITLLAVTLVAWGSASAAVSGTATELPGVADRLGSCTATAPAVTSCTFEADAGWGPTGTTGGVLGASGDGFTGTVDLVARDHITGTAYWTYTCQLAEGVSVCHWTLGEAPRWGPFVSGPVTVEAHADGEGTWTAYLDRPTAFPQMS